MSNPLAYLPLALAGANGALNGLSVRRLVSAGVALLQRSAPLVRSLSGHRSGILLPPSPALLVALAASEGRAAALLDPDASTDELAIALRREDAAAVFTTIALANRLPSGLPVLLLDEAPERATWLCDGDRRTIDLAWHGGLHLTGEADEPGADEAVLVASGDDRQRDALGVPITHRRVMASAVATGVRERLGERDHTLTIAASPTLFAVVAGVVAPLMAGGRVTTAERVELDGVWAIEQLETAGVSGIVAPAAAYGVLLDALHARGRALDAPVLQRCLAGSTGGELDDTLARRWYDATGVRLRVGDVVGSDGAFGA
ncbi:MAG: hypothetical protein IT359_20560 [Gemmatimonadaceae bacterium]|nr:hypothetical protein [Gemmatimonadaceae bacterium]